MNNSIFETGATTHALNDLILFTENTRELAEMRDKIFEKEYTDSLPSFNPMKNKRLPLVMGLRLLFKKSKEQYLKELNAYENKHIRNLTTEEETEFIALYTGDYKTWLQENKKA